MSDHVLAHLRPLPLLLSCTFTYQSVVSHLDRRAINKLGSFAPRYPNSLAFGTEIIVRSISHARKDTVFEFWDWIFTFTLTSFAVQQYST